MLGNYAPPRFRFSDDADRLDQLRQAYSRDGFAIVENFFSAADCRALMARANELVATADLSAVTTIFSTRSLRHAADEYFESSGDKIRFFFEEDAFDAQGRLTCPREHAINKIGHALHDLDDVFNRFSRNSRLAGLISVFGLRRPLLLQSMYIFKQPNIGGEVVCHTDSTYLYTEPLSAIGLWVALEDATTTNGCLWALPGQHTGPLKSRFRRCSSGLTTDVYDDSPWPMEHKIPLEVRQGTLIVLDGLCPHMSEANRSSRSRHAYTLHVIDGACVYPADNWLQRGSDMPLKGF